MKKNSVLLMILCSVSVSALAQSDIYKYKDAKGVVVYSDKPPVKADGEISVFSKSTGILKSVGSSNMTKEDELALAEEEKKAAQQKDANQLKKDQMLLNTYSSLKEIDELKNYELQQIERAIQNDINVVASLNERKKQIDKELEKSPNGSNENKEEYKRVSENIEKTNSNLEKNKAMYSLREKKYNEDKKRYGELLKELGKE